MNYKVALNGQIYNSDGLLYAYPENVVQLRAGGGYPAWINALPYDSRFLRDIVVAEGECFSIRYGKEGLFYAYTRFNPFDTRNGTVYVSLYTQDKAVRDIPQLIITLRNMMDYFLEKSSVSDIRDTEVEELLQRISDYYNLSIPSQDTPIPTKDAIRVYHSQEELNKMLNLSIQKDYLGYKWIHFVAGEHKKPVLNLTKYVELKTPLLECYALYKNPTANPEWVLRGTQKTIPYEKEGFLPCKIPVIIGQPSPYLDIDTRSGTIFIKPVNETNLKFKKNIIIRAIDSITGANIPSLIINGVNKDNPTIEIGENQELRIKLSANGYREKIVSVDLKKIDATGVLAPFTLEKITKSPNHYDRGEDIDDIDSWDETFTISKRTFVIRALLLILIVGVISCIFGIGLQRHVLPLPINPQDTARINMLGAQIELLNTKIEQLQNSIKSKEKDLKSKDDKISELENKLKKERSKDNPSSSGLSKNNVNLNETAITYLNTTDDKWSLFGMRKYVNASELEMKDIKSYQFLKKVIEGKDLNAIVEYDAVNNDTWTTIRDLIIKKKNKSDKIKEAIKNSNTNLNEPADGELRLEMLKNKLTVLK